MTLRLAISMGDFNGIGPEVVLKALAGVRLEGLTPLVIGSGEVFDYYASRMDDPPAWRSCDSPSGIREGMINLLECCGPGEEGPRPGEISERAGRAAMQAVKEGIRLCTGDGADALVTAPISKEAVNRAGYRIPGHTEFLAEQTGAERVLMILVSGSLRVALSTGHIPLGKVAERISGQELQEQVALLARSLREDFGIRRPRVALLGLNPHAGDGGVIGSEEIDIIAPAIENASRSGTEVSGPYPADGFFGRGMQQNFDAVLAMYHDQGLVPFKTLSFGKGVNFTAGLPIVRTSPDHGTAFDIAGENRADPSSLREAFGLAAELARNRKRTPSHD